MLQECVKTFEAITILDRSKFREKNSEAFWNFLLSSGSWIHNCGEGWLSSGQGSPSTPTLMLNAGGSEEGRDTASSRAYSTLPLLYLYVQYPPCPWHPRGSGIQDDPRGKRKKILLNDLSENESLARVSSRPVQENYGPQRPISPTCHWQRIFSRHNSQWKPSSGSSSSSQPSFQQHPNIPERSSTSHKPRPFHTVEKWDNQTVSQLLFFFLTHDLTKDWYIMWSCFVLVPSQILIIQAAEPSSTSQLSVYLPESYDGIVDLWLAKCVTRRRGGVARE